jgi:fucose 4-O-acetylase-like acetyltransferase
MLAAQGLFRELPYEKPAGRLDALDAARGLAIFLVVVGHVVARNMPEGNAWYAVLKEEIYLFHMPLFMALTGITFALSLPRFSAWADLWRYCGRRVERLFLPYVAFGLLIIVGKHAAARFVHVDNLPGSSALMSLFVMPRHSGVEFLWFIYVLSIYLALVPAFFQLAGRRPGLLLALAVALYAARPLPELFMLDDAAKYLPFFALGALLWAQRRAWLPMRDDVLYLSSAVFALTLVFGLRPEVPEWIPGAASVLPVLGWMQRLPDAARERLAVLGRASLAIYLINTIAIGVTKGLMLKVLPWDGVNFLLYFPVLTAAGVCVPLAVRHFALRYTPRAARYVA